MKNEIKYIYMNDFLCLKSKFIFALMSPYLKVFFSEEYYYF